MQHPQPGDFKNHTLNPYGTGTSVLAMRFQGGVMLVADTLVSQGTTARFRKFQRLVAIGDTLIGASGEMSDFQYVVKDLEALLVGEQCSEDGATRSAKSIHNYLSRVYYARRSKVDPLWNQVLVAGCRDGQPFLGSVDLLGTTFEDVELATGYGAHIARPLLRNAYREGLSAEEVEIILTDCMRVLFYRDCKTINSIQFATVTAAGVEIRLPVELATQWEFKQFVKSGYQ